MLGQLFFLKIYFVKIQSVALWFIVTCEILLIIFAGVIFACTAFEISPSGCHKPASAASTADKTTGKETMTYEVIRIYACPVDVWQKQAAKYIQNLGLNSDSADLKKAASMADELVKDLKPGFAE